MSELLKKKRILLLTLVAVFVLSLVSFAGAQPPDIKGHWAEQQISSWFDKGLAKGYEDGTFKPDSTITRAEFAAMVNRAFDFKESGTVSFSDVGANKWYAKDVSIASAAGYIAGYGDGTFGPDNKITRQEAAVMIARILKLDTTDLAQADVFGDAAKIQQWGKGAIGAIYKAKIMQGYQDNSFRPGNPITRAESVVTIDRSMGYAPVEKPEVDTDAVDSAIEGKVTLDGKGTKAEVLIFNNGSYEAQKKVETDNDGAFKIKLAAGSYDITASTDKEVGYASEVKVAADKVAKQDVELTEAAIVKGELRDKSGNVLKNVDVHFTTNPTFVGKTNSKGEFSLPVLPNRSYEVRAAKSNKDDTLFVVAKNLEVGNAGTFRLDAPIKAPFAVSSSGGGGGGSSSGTTVTQATVKTAAEFEKALANNDIRTITLGCDIAGEVTATRAGSNSLTIEFGANVLTGSLSITATNLTSLTFNGSATKSITENLTVDAPKASVTNGIVVGGNVNIVDVKVGTWTETADGNKLIITDETGATIIIEGKPSSVTVKESADGTLSITVNEGASVGTITSNAPVNITVSAGATVEEIIAEAGSAGSTIISNGTIGILTANDDVTLKATVSPGKIDGNGEVNTVWLPRITSLELPEDDPLAWVNDFDNSKWDGATWDGVTVTGSLNYVDDTIITGGFSGENWFLPFAIAAPKTDIVTDKTKVTVKGKQGGTDSEFNYTGSQFEDYDEGKALLVVWAVEEGEDEIAITVDWDESDEAQELQPFSINISGLKLLEPQSTATITLDGEDGYTNAAYGNEDLALDADLKVTGTLKYHETDPTGMGFADYDHHFMVFTVKDLPENATTVTVKGLADGVATTMDYPITGTSEVFVWGVEYGEDIEITVQYADEKYEEMVYTLDLSGVILAEEELLKAPEDGLKELEIAGLTENNVKYMAFGLNVDGGEGGPQKVATLEEVKTFINDTYGAEFNAEAIKIEEGKLSIEGSILSKADWRKVKAGGNSEIPYRITVLITDKTNKVAKIAMYEDGVAVIEDLQVAPKNTDASVSSITVQDVAATVDGEDGTVYNVELPNETDLSELEASDIIVEATDNKATVAEAVSEDNGATWTVVVTAEDGTTTETYTINVTVETEEQP